MLPPSGRNVAGTGRGHSAMVFTNEVPQNPRPPTKSPSHGPSVLPCHPLTGRPPGGRTATGAGSGCSGRPSARSSSGTRASSATSTPATTVRPPTTLVALGYLPSLERPAMFPPHFFPPRSLRSHPPRPESNLSHHNLPMGGAVQQIPFSAVFLSYWARRGQSIHEHPIQDPSDEPPGDT